MNAQKFEWAKSFGGPGSDQSYAVTLDAFGNVYSTGFFEDSVGFDPGTGTNNLTSAGLNDVYVQKMDSNGNFLWAKSFGGISQDYAYTIRVDTSGNVYTAGLFEGTVDFNLGVGINNLTSLAGSRDVFVQKMDVNGNFLWAKSFGGTSDDVATSIAVDNMRNVYTTGYFQYTVDFNPNSGTNNITSNGWSIDIFVQKMDANGNFVWAKRFGSNATDKGKAITVDAYGNIYTTGYVIRFGGGHDVFIRKMDVNGNSLWVKYFGGALEDEASSIAVDSSGNVYTTGYFEYIVDFDPGAGILNLTAAGWPDVFVHKLDANGNFLWVKTFGSTSTEEGSSICIDASGNVYTTGYFSGTVDFDSGAGISTSTSFGSNDIFVQKLNSNGNFLWTKTFGGTSNEKSSSIGIDTSGNLYTAGYFLGTVDFDHGTGTSNLSASGWGDVFVQKMSQCTPNTGADTITTCDSYTWIDGITYSASNNSTSHTLINTEGCDSVVTLNLTINSISDLTTSI